MLAEPAKLRDCLDSLHHAEAAVVAAGIAHAVDVRADQQRLGRSCRPLDPADDGAGGIERDRHAGLGHPSRNERDRCLVIPGEVEACDLTGHAGDRRQLVQSGENAGGECVSWLT